MANVIPKLNLNKHPKVCDNNSLIDARNIVISDDGTIQNDYSIEYNKTIHEGIINHTKVNDYNIVWGLPCNTELIIFVKVNNKSRIANTDNLIVFRYDEEHNCLLHVTDIFEYHGGKLTGTFTYNVNNDLIVSISEFDADEDYPLRIINFGRIQQKDNGEYYVYTLDNNINQRDTYDLQCIKPKIYLPTVEKGVYNANWWKGWNYFFIRFKIDNNNYTQWYDLNTAIYTDTYGTFSLVRGRIKKPDGTLGVGSGYVNPKSGIQDIEVRCAQSDIICTTAPKLVLNRLIANNKISYYQLGVIISNKKQTLCKITNDINISNNVYSFNSMNVFNYEVTDIIETTAFVKSPERVINYNNKLFISNYKENNYNIDLNDFVKDNFKFKLTRHVVPKDFSKEGDYRYFNINVVDKNFIIPIAQLNTSYDIPSITFDSDWYRELIDLICLPSGPTNNYYPFFKVENKEDLPYKVPFNEDIRLEYLSKNHYVEYNNNGVIEITDMFIDPIAFSVNSGKFIQYWDHKLNPVDLGTNITLVIKSKNNIYERPIDLSRINKTTISISMDEYNRCKDDDSYEVFVDSRSETGYSMNVWTADYYARNINDLEKEQYKFEISSTNIDNKGCFLPHCCYNLFIHFVDEYGQSTYGIPVLSENNNTIVDIVQNDRYKDYIGLTLIDNDYVTVYVYVKKDVNISDLYKELLTDNFVYRDNENIWQDWDEVSDNHLYILKVVPKFQTNDVELIAQNNYVEFPHLYFANNDITEIFKYIYYFAKKLNSNYVDTELFNDIYNEYATKGFKSALDLYSSKLEYIDNQYFFEDNKYRDTYDVFAGYTNVSNLGNITDFHTLCTLIIIDSKIAVNVYGNDINNYVNEQDEVIIDNEDDWDDGLYWYRTLRYFAGYFWYNILNNKDYHIEIPEDVLKEISPNNVAELRIDKWKEYFVYLFNQQNKNLLNESSNINIPITDYKINNIIDNDSYTVNAYELTKNEFNEYLISTKDACWLSTSCKIPDGYIGYFISYELFEDTYIPGHLYRLNNPSESSIGEYKYNAKFVTELGELEDSFSNINSVLIESRDSVTGEYISHKIIDVENYTLRSSGSIDNLESISAFYLRIDDDAADSDATAHLYNKYKSNLYNNKNKQLIPLSQYIYTEDIFDIDNGNYNGMLTCYDDIRFNGVVYYDSANGQFNKALDSYEYSTTAENSENLSSILTSGEVSTYYNKSIMSKHVISGSDTLNMMREVKIRQDDKDINKYEFTKYITPSHFKNLFQNNAASVDEYYPKTLTNYKNYIEYKSEFNKTIRYSNIIQSESKDIAWRRFNVEHYKNINENKGDITNIIGIGNQLLVHTEHSLFGFVNNDSIEALNNNIKLSNTSITDLNYKEIITSSLGYAGLQFRDSWIVGQYGYIYYDNDSKNIYRYDGGKLNVINQDIKVWMRTNPPKDIKFYDDVNNNRIISLFKFKDNVDIVMSYNYLTNWWVSKHDITIEDGYNTKNVLYINNIKWLSNYTKTRSHILTPNDYITFDSKISIINNTNYEVIKYIDAIFYKIYKIYPTNNVNNTFPINEYDINYSGDFIRIFNNLYDTGTLDIAVNTQNYDNKSLPVNYPIVTNGSFIQENFKKPYYDKGNWNFNYIRHNIAEEDIDFTKKARIEGNWFVTTFEFFPITDEVIEFDTIDYKLSNI